MGEEFGLLQLVPLQCEQAPEIMAYSAVSLSGSRDERLGVMGEVKGVVSSFILRLELCQEAGSGSVASDEGSPFARGGLGARRRHSTTSSPSTAMHSSSSSLIGLTSKVKRGQGAEATSREALGTWVALLGEANVNAIVARGNLAHAVG